ncbi:DUF5074 domain-containing protein [Limibacter armeniacum]|uniref:DUF5074 domain-containing protein n=1 Tax=Limibacter armeniacum TaxID=466084 RepID=UPI002FE556BF
MDLKTTFHKLNFRAFLPYLLALTVVFTSCDDDSNETPTLQGALVINAGGFGNGDGSIDIYDEETQTIQNKAFAKANSRELAATIESILIYNGQGVIMCNTADKVEFFDPSTLTSLVAPIESVVVPRYAAGNGNFLYVTCWGAWGENWDLPDSYIAKIDLSTHEVVKEIPVGDGAEGILIHDGKIFVANPYAYPATVEVYDISNDELVKTLSFDASPQRLVLDKNNQIWVSLTNGFPASANGVAKINPQTLEVETKVTLEGIDSYGKIALNSSKDEVLVLAVEPYTEENNGENLASEVWILDTDTESFDSSPVISGVSFSGIGCNPSTGNIYVAKAPSYASNGSILIYDEQGQLVDEATAGIGPYQFVF